MVSVNILDENIPDAQRDILRDHRLAVRHVGRDIGWKGVKDHEIIPLLLRLHRPTFFTRDVGFYRRTWRHARYCLVVMNVTEVDAAKYVRRLLRHPEFRTRAQRMGLIIRLSPSSTRPAGETAMNRPACAASRGAACWSYRRSASPASRA